MKKVLGVAAIAGLILFSGFYFFTGQQHPVPAVSVEGTPIPVTEGSYCWSNLIGSECVDKAYSSPYEMGMVYEPVLTVPAEEIRIRFDHPPDKGSLTVERWADESGGEAFSPDEGTFLAPQQSGVYVYHVMAQWEKGDGSYAFSIQVE